MSARTPEYASRVINTMRGFDLLSWVPQLELWIGDPRAGGQPVTGTGYSPKVITVEDPAGLGISQAVADIVFTLAAPVPWGTPTHAVVRDPGTNEIRYIGLWGGTATQREIKTGDPVIVKSTDLQFIELSIEVPV